MKHFHHYYYYVLLFRRNRLRLDDYLFGLHIALEVYLICSKGYYIEDGSHCPVECAICPTCDSGREISLRGKMNFNEILKDLKILC